MSRTYLALYNGCQLAGWSCVLLGLLLHASEVVAAPADAAAGVYASLRGLVSIVQTATLLETLHAAFGLVRSGVVGNVAQWAGRTHCWWLVTRLPELQRSPAVVAMLFCWSLSDVVRYAWALLSTLRVCTASLTTLRYTAFIPLYPLGAAAELMLMALALPAAAAGFGSVAMPNRWNFALDYARFLFAVMLLYPPLWLQLYGHMFRQRRSKLSAERPKQS